MLIPLYLDKIPCGFPSPASDFEEKRIDLNELMIKHPSATYLLRASGDSMINGHIQNGDLLVVDSALKPKQGDIIIASLFGEFTVKQLYLTPKVVLQPMNHHFKAIEISSIDDLEIFGVVTYVIHKV